MTVKVTGEPKPVISWTKDGRSVSQGGKYEIFEEHGSAHLEIYDSDVSDSGVYKCTATNSAGSVTSSCTVTIKESLKSAKVMETKAELTEQTVKKDIVHQEVQSFTEIKASQTKVTFTEGQAVTLKANIPGASDVKWILNGVELANSADYRHGISGNDHTLTIRNVRLRDSGILTCEAKTEQGLIKCQFDTKISEKRSDAPKFLEQPRSQNVNEGQDIIFSCEITGDPTPEIEWLKDNSLSVTSNMKLSRSKNVYKLEIQNATLEDSGKYTVKAKNQFGQCSATASLNVLTLVEEPMKMIVVEKSSYDAGLAGGYTALHMASSMQEAAFSSSSMAQVKLQSMSAASMTSMTSETMVAMSSSSMMEMSSRSHVVGSSIKSISRVPPKIESAPQDISIESGKVLTVACAFTGDPVPSVEWSHSGRILSNKERGRFQIETTEDVTTLIISGIKENDAGAYTLRLSNELGSDSATVNVSIRSM
uniref:Ig-like domain-containing protein n=1 Tax=Electrophorus electricus TaxID=8005 RepID=A0AAY5EH03_ELEEL